MREKIPIGKTKLLKRKSKSGSLIRQAKGDAASFSEVYRAYAPRVYRYVYARVGNQQDAEDITAQVFEVALRGLKDFDGGRNFSAWLFTIARNKVVDTYRSGGRESSLESAGWLATEDADPMGSVIKKEGLSELLVQVRTLQSDEQELLSLRFAARLKYAEIGEVLGKKTGAVKMAVRRLVQRLHDEME